MAFSYTQDTVSTVVDGVPVMLRLEFRDIDSTQGVYKHWWLIVDDTPVAFLKTLTYQRKQYALVLCDVEVREPYRGRGFSKLIIKSVENIEGHTMYTSGTFTPDGCQRLGFVTPYPGAVVGVSCEPMSFVNNWDNFTARYLM